MVSISEEQFMEYAEANDILVFNKKELDDTMQNLVDKWSSEDRENLRIRYTQALEDYKDLWAEEDHVMTTQERGDLYEDLANRLMLLVEEEIT